MKAVVLNGTCDASELGVKEVPIPDVKPGWVLVKVHAFGINHSDIIMRSEVADKPYINLPRIMGIECVGEIADPSDSKFKKGQRVVALMGGMGRSFDGGYAEYALLPTKQVFAANIDLEWEELAAIPETYFTAYGSLFQSMQLKTTDTMLIRGGTSALGLAAVQLAKSIGCTVLATTRQTEKLELLKEHGVDFPLLDNETLSEQINTIMPNGISKILELVGAATLKESMSFLDLQGIICVTGNLGQKYYIDEFDPIKYIPNSVYLSSFFSNYPTQEIMDNIFDHIQRYNLTPPIAKVFSIDEIAQAHILMESNNANGKIVVVNRSEQE